MTAVPANHVLLLAVALLAIGLATVIVRRNAVFMLLGVEVMLAAAGLAFVGAGARWGHADGQVMLLFILATAAAEVAVGLAVVLRLDRQLGGTDTDRADELGERHG